MTLTANQLITDALKDLRVLGVGRSIQPEDAQTALRYLQELIDSWAIDRLTIYKETRTQFTLVPNQANYLIGPNSALVGFFYAVRPVWISSATVIPVGSSEEIPLEMWDRDRYAYEPLKTQTDLYPQALYMEPLNPDAVLNFWPMPTTAAAVVLGIPSQITGFANLTTSYAFPPGYAEAFRTALVRKLARPFGRQVTQDIVIDADEALARVKRRNIPGADGPTVIAVDDALIGGADFDIMLGDYRNRR